jgi:hypothetical protein
MYVRTHIYIEIRGTFVRADRMYIVRTSTSICSPIRDTTAVIPFI